MPIKELKINRLSISGINEQLKEKFIEFSKANALPYRKTLQRIWDDFKYFHTALNQEEKELARKAAEIAGQSFEEIRKKAIMKAVRGIIDNNAIIDKNIHSNKKVADLRIAEIVSEMITNNDKEKKWYNRKFISQKSIENYANERKRIANSNNLTPGIIVIKRYIESNRALLDEHHLKHKMNKEHNRKAYNYKKIQDNKQKQNTAIKQGLDYNQEQKSENIITKEVAQKHDDAKNKSITQKRTQ